MNVPEFSSKPIEPSADLSWNKAILHIGKQDYTISRLGTNALFRKISDTFNRLRNKPSQYVAVEISKETDKTKKVYLKKTELEKKLGAGALIVKKEISLRDLSSLIPSTSTTSTASRRARTISKVTPQVGDRTKKIAVPKIQQLGQAARASLLQKTKLTDAEYERFLAFANEKKDEWERLSRNSPPVHYGRNETGLSRSVTYVPGQGLLIHLKGERRGLARIQLGQRGAQGVVTMAVNLHTGALSAYKSMKLDVFDANSKQRLEMHGVLKDFPDEFASGHVVRYKHNGIEKVGICMPYMAGGDLEEPIGNREIDSQRQISYGLQLAKQLAHLHQLGYLHRDLKPDNVLVSEDKTKIVLADFDIAVKKDSKNVYQVTGNLRYMPPEAFVFWLQNQCNQHNLTDLSRPFIITAIGFNLAQANVTNIDSKSPANVIKEIQNRTGEK